jgi:hypothetical protein
MLELNNPKLENSHVKTMTEEDFADLGMDNVVYVQEVSLDEAQFLFPEIEEFPQISQLYAVHAANGTPVLLAEDLYSAKEAAENNKLVVHTVN